MRALAASPPASPPTRGSASRSPRRTSAMGWQGSLTRKNSSIFLGTPFDSTRRRVGGARRSRGAARRAAVARAGAGAVAGASPRNPRVRGCPSGDRCPSPSRGPAPCSPAPWGKKSLPRPAEPGAEHVFDAERAGRRLGEARQAENLSRDSDGHLRVALPARMRSDDDGSVDANRSSGKRASEQMNGRTDEENTAPVRADWRRDQGIRWRSEPIAQHLP
jgi:hypothetical protein